MEKVIIIFLIFFSSELFAQQDSIVEPILDDEISVVREIVASGIGDRFVIPGIKTSRAGICSVTITTVRGMLQLLMEQSYDVIPFASDFETGEGGTDINGNRSIHRFKGYVKISSDGITFIGTGNEDSRLTFLLLENIGYVYVRGEGKIIFPDGRVVFFRKNE